MKIETTAGRSRSRQAPRQGAARVSAQTARVDIVHMAETEAQNRRTQRQAMICDAAYFRAERRGFEPGHELEDWLAAEVDVALAQQLVTLSPNDVIDSGRPS